MTGDGRKSGRERRGRKEVLALTSQLRSVGFLLLLNQMIVPPPSLAKEERLGARESLLNGAEGKKEVSSCLEETGVPGRELQSVVVV